tara:strand:- start:291 stop:521 length:231 start_codon:yes stop_codon:yes gene_type:complete
MKNLSLLIIFSLPLIIIFVERNIFKQISDQYPISFPPNNTILDGIKSVGKNNIEIEKIPKKKKNKNKLFFIILIKG